MAAAGQSTKPSEFLPIIRARIASAVGLSETYVRIVARPDPKSWSYHTNDHAVAIHLSPYFDKTDAGAGRVATPTSQTLEVYLRTRSLQDQAGGNESAISTHTDKELQIINALHLPEVVFVNGSGRPLFYIPPRLIPDGESIERNEKLAGVIETVLRFKLDYVLAVEV